MNRSVIKISEKPKWVIDFENKAEFVFLLAKAFDESISDSVYRDLVKSFANKLDAMKVPEVKPEQPKAPDRSVEKPDV